MGEGRRYEGAGVQLSSRKISGELAEERIFGAEGRPASAVARRSPPAKLGRPEGNNKNALHQGGAQRSIRLEDTEGGQAAGQADPQLIDDSVRPRHRFIRDGGPAFGS